MLPLIGNRASTRIPAAHARILQRIAPFDVAWALFTPILAFLIRDGMIKQTDVVAGYCIAAVFASLVAFQWFKISSPLVGFFSVNDALAVTKACLTTVALTTVTVFSFT